MGLSSPANSRLGPKVAESVLASVLVLASSCALAARAPLLNPQQQPTDPPGESRWAAIRRAQTIAFFYNSSSSVTFLIWHSREKYSKFPTNMELLKTREGKMLQEWGRFKLVDSAAQADLVLVFSERTEDAPCEDDKWWERMLGGNCTYGTSGLQVIKGGSPPTEYPEPLWEAGFTGEDPHVRPHKWLKDFRKFVEKLEAAAGRSSSVKQRIEEWGVGARVKGKFADSEKFKGSIESVAEDAFRLTGRNLPLSRRIFYEEVDELKVTQLTHQPSGRLDAAEAKQVISDLGVSKYVEVTLADGKKQRGWIQSIEDDHLVLMLPEVSDTVARIPYQDIVRVK